jgi:hypothetical protein
MQAYSVSDAGSTDAAAQQASTLVSLAGSPDQLTDDAKTAVLSLALQLASRVDGNDPTAAGNLLSAVGAVSKEAVEGLKAAMAPSAPLEVRTSTHHHAPPRAPLVHRCNVLLVVLRARSVLQLACSLREKNCLQQRSLQQ